MVGSDSVTLPMRAVRAHGSNVADLRYESTPCPRWAPGWLLVRVHAVGVDSDELLWPSTWSTPDGLDRAPSTLGRDVAGVVVQADRDAAIGVGEDVFGIVDWWCDGGAADYVLLRPDHVARKPAGMSYAEAAAMPTAAMVALRTIDMLGDATAGSRLLVDGRPDAVALLTIQLARRNGIDVVGTGAGSNAEYLAFFGVNDVVEDSRERILDAARTADLILSTRGSEHAAWLRDASRRPVATPSSSYAAEGSARDHPFGVPMGPSPALLDRLAATAESEHLRSPVAFALPLALARDAYEWTDRNAHRLRGRAVLEPIEDITAYEIDPILELVAEAEAQAE
jgi:NADPH:quinone reductase-like Zn-dependent oxidoreductase